MDGKVIDLEPIRGVSTTNSVPDKIDRGEVTDGKGRRFSRIDGNNKGRKASDLLKPQRAAP